MLTPANPPVHIVVINPLQRAWAPIAPPVIDWHGEVPVSRTSGDIYFSTDNGLAETDYVFIDGNQLPSRWARAPQTRPFVIAEIGFGTGLNALRTLSRWRSEGGAGRALHYIGIEHAPLGRADIERTLAHWPELGELTTTLLRRWPDPLPGCHRRRFPEWGVTLDLWWGDAAETLDDLASYGQRWVDAWYLDGFAPAREQGPWCDSVYRSMAALSRPGATFATFTAAGAVRRGLSEAGFRVEKRPGFGAKREALWGELERVDARTPAMTPWDLNPSPGPLQQVLILGAGLAGAHLARVLAERGVRVTVLEAHAVAGGGSGNLQGITYTRLSRLHNPLTDFSLASFQYATNLYDQWRARGDLEVGVDMGSGGYLQLNDDTETLSALAQALKPCPGFAEILSADAIAERLGIRPRCGGIHYQRGGWLDPRAVCRVALSHPGIRVIEQCGPVSLYTTPEGIWQAVDTHGATLASAPMAVLATASAVRAHPGLEWLPLTTIRGQTTHVPTQPALQQLDLALCDQGYLPPAREGIHCMGASYGPGDCAMDEREAEHAHNVAMMQSALPDLALTPPAAGWRGHVALRCNSNDYLPVLGVAPDRARFEETYARLRHDRKERIDAALPCLSGLAVFTALGSRGLSAAPLGAEIIADQLLGGPPALPRYLHRAVAPGRFLERHLKRGTTP